MQEIKLKTLTHMKSIDGKQCALVKEGTTVNYDKATIGPVVVHVCWLDVDGTIFLTEKVSQG